MIVSLTRCSPLRLAATLARDGTVVAAEMDPADTYNTLKPLARSFTTDAAIFAEQLRARLPASCQPPKMS